MKLESLKKLKVTVEKCLEELANKEDLTPVETKAALDGFELREWVLCEIENCRMEEEYSERGHMHRGYSGESARIPYRKYDITAYGHMDRSPMERGWYENNSDWHTDRNYNYGYSRHSIGDRVIEKMENMMDQTESEYEREELRKFMKMIRQAAD